VTFNCHVWHRHLGLCEINQMAIALQRQRGTEASIFVDHRSELIEVTRDLVEPEWTPMTIAPPKGLPVMVRNREGNRVERRANTVHPPDVKFTLFRERSKLETDFEPKEWMPAPPVA